MLWLCAVAFDEECVRGEILNSALELGLATDLLFVLENVPGKILFFSGEEFIFLFPFDSVRGLIWSFFLSSTIKVDDFTARLFRIYMQVLEEGLAQVPWQETPAVSSCAPLQCGGFAWSLSASLLAAVGFELSHRPIAPYATMSRLQPVSSGPCPL